MSKDKRLFLRSFFSFCFLIYGLFPIFLPNAAASESIDFNENWKFIRSDCPEAAWRCTPRNLLPRMAQMTGNDLLTAKLKITGGGVRPEGLEWTMPNFDDSGWTGLNLPHDWAIFEDFTYDHDPTESYLPCSGTGWYRKTFTIPAEWNGKQIALDFDGVMSFAAVWVNGQFAGGWPYGYTSFRIDATPYIHYDAPNTVAVRVAHPVQTSRWYTGGGIYRNVRLTAQNPVHLAHWSHFVRAENISAEKASVKVSASVQNETKEEKNVRIQTFFYRRNADGSLGGLVLGPVQSESITVKPGETFQLDLSAEIPNPALWSVDSPEMYAAQTTLLEGKNPLDDQTALDAETAPFGIRSIEFTADRGFLLNGEPVKIKGCCLHHDLGPLGAAVNLSAMERQLTLLREAGCNAVRLSHNPADPAMMDLLDRLGFLVQAEAFDQWTEYVPQWRSGGYYELFPDWHEKDLRALIRRDRNHPSVIMWSIGNEIPELRTPEKFIALGTELCRIVKEEDPTRPTTSACNNPAAGYNGVQNLFDLFGYNYYGHKQYAKFHEQNPDKPAYGSETTCTMSTRGYYLFPLDKHWMGGIADYSHSAYGYQACGWNPDKPLDGWAAPPDIEFETQDRFDWVCGEFIWTGIDYLGGPYYVGDMEVKSRFTKPELEEQAQKEREKYGVARCPLRVCETGLFDTAGFAKDIFWLYRSYWRPDVPTAHLLPHWNWPGREGEVTPVHLFTSGGEAELFLNGKSLGRKKKGEFEYRLCWDDVVYEPGKLEAVVYKNGERWAAETVETAGTPAGLRLTADRSAVAPDGKECAFITCDILDAEGRVVPTADNELCFTAGGGAKIIASDNGDGRDWTPYNSPVRKAFAGKCLAVVVLEPGTAAPVTLRVTSENLSGAEITIEPKNFDPKIFEPKN